MKAEDKAKKMIEDIKENTRIRWAYFDSLSFGEVLSISKSNDIDVRQEWGFALYMVGRTLKYYAPIVGMAIIGSLIMKSLHKIKQ